MGPGKRHLILTATAAVALLALGLGFGLARAPFAPSSPGPLVAAAVPGDFLRAGHAHRPKPLPRATLTVARGSGLAVPSSFLGLSSEYWALTDYERTGGDFVRALSALQVPASGPLVLRIGGSSADGSYWNPTGERLPHWAYSLAPAWLRATAAVVREARLSVIVDLDMSDDAPWLTGAWARAVVHALGSSHVLAFELGNEPDLYRGHRLFRAQGTGHGRYRLVRLGTISRYTVGDYLEEASAYAQTLARMAPGVALAGPAIANVYSDREWITDLLATERSRLGIVTGHRYPLSACQRPGWRYYPTIPKLLSNSTIARMTTSVRYAVEVSHRAGLPFRLTELNAVTCGGMKGVSDTFASALWAPDVMFSLLGVGVDGVNFHTRPLSRNGPFYLIGDSLGIRPMFYGLVLFQRALGPGARLLSTRVQQSPELHLAAWTLRLRGGGLRVVVLNKGARAAELRLSLPARGAASVQWLHSRSLTARSGVTFAGRWLGQDGHWHGQARSYRVTRSRAGYALVVPGYSGALLTVS